MERVKQSHAVLVTPRGRRGFRETFDIDPPEPGGHGERRRGTPANRT